MKVNQIGECDDAVPSAACLQTPFAFEDKDFELLTLRRLMSYIYGAPILDVSRSHTTTQHSR